MNILIVDNFPGSISTLRIRLEKEGYQVMYASNIWAAEDIIEKNAIHFLVMDLNLASSPHTESVPIFVNGWVLLHDLYDKYFNSNSDEFKEKTIIYSDYIKKLKEETVNLWPDDLNKVLLVEKNEYDHGVQRIIEHIKGKSH